MEEPEQQREHGRESAKGRGAGGAAERRLESPPRGPRRRQQARFTGGLQGLPLLLLRPTVRPRPPSPAAAAATAVP